MAVGDVNSTERGSGARYNDGKPALDLLPLSHLARYYYSVQPAGTEYGVIKAIDALLMLGVWQETGQPDALRKALSRMDFALTPDSPRVIEEAARVFDYGRAKYAAWNWSKGMKWSVPLACAARHLRKIIEEGEWLDAESGLPHRGHFACNVFMLLTFMRTYPEGDDRPRDLLPAPGVQ